MKGLVVVVLLCLLAAPALAASVAVKTSGIAPGSNYRIFTYSPADTETVVTGVLPNDLITIQYPDKDHPGELQALTYFFTTQYDNVWNYKVFKGTEEFSIKIGERKPIDLYGDGQVELYMEFTRLDIRRGVFTFYNANAPATAPVNTTTTNVTVPESETTNQTPLLGGDRDAHGCIPSAGYSWCEAKQKCLRVWEEQCEANVAQNTSAPPKNVTQPPLDEPESSFPWGIVTIVVLVLGAVGAYFYFMREPEGDGEERGEKKKNKKELGTEKKHEKEKSEEERKRKTDQEEELKKNEEEEKKKSEEEPEEGGEEEKLEEEPEEADVEEERETDEWEKTG